MLTVLKFASRAVNGELPEDVRLKTLHGPMPGSFSMHPSISILNDAVLPCKCLLQIDGRL